MLVADVHEARDRESGSRIPDLAENEVADGIRTRDHRDHNPGLYQLSYRHRGRDRIAAPVQTSRFSR
jgi:hypothetical protein